MAGRGSSTESTKATASEERTLLAAVGRGDISHGKVIARVQPPQASPAEKVLAKGLAEGVINELEAETVREAMAITTKAIAVDDFPGRPRKAGQQAA